MEGRNDSATTQCLRFKEAVDNSIDYKQRYEEIIELDKNHDLLFEQYLNSRGWKSKPMYLSNENDFNTSADTSGSYHGDNIRFNLFPDSTDRLDAFDAEVDGFSDWSSNSEIQPQYDIRINSNSNPNNNRENILYNVYNDEPEHEIDNIDDNYEYESDNNNDSNNEPVNENNSHEETVIYAVEEIPFSNTENHGLSTDFNLIYPLRDNKFIYTRTSDINKNFTKKLTDCTIVSHSANDSGIPLNAKDTLINYKRFKTTDLNCSNLDKIFESKNAMFAISNQPMQKFPPSTVLNIKDKDQQKLIIPEQGNYGISGYFRSNLSSVYYRKGFKILVIATGSRVNFFDLDIPTSTSCKHKFLGWIDIKFRATTVEQIRNSVNPYEPYSINYLTIKEYTEPNLDTYNVLAVCNDYSQVVVLNMDEILEYIYRSEGLTPKIERQLYDDYNSNDESMIFECFFVKNSIPLFKSTFHHINTPLDTNASAWCVDIHNNFVAVSDNHRMISIYHNNQLIASSPVLSHNIPYLNILPMKENGKIFYISCGTYGSHIYILKFNITSPSVSVQDVIETDSPIWSCNFVNHNDFLNVNSMKELSGNIISDSDENKINTIITQSEILNANSDPKFSSHFGLCAYFTHLTVPSITSRHFQKSNNNKCMSANEIHQLDRIRKIYDEFYMSYIRPFDETKSQKPKVCSTKCGDNDKLSDVFIIATSAQSIGLFSFKELINLSSCKTVFPIIESPYILERNDNNENSIDISNEFISYRPRGRETHIMPPGFQFLNRIYLSFLIPQLNAIIVATQAGQLAVFRLTHFNGLHSMRLEWLLMDPERYAMSQNGNVRSIIGLSGYPSGIDSHGNSEWVIVVVCSDLLTLRYKISKNYEKDKDEFKLFDII